MRHVGEIGYDSYKRRIEFCFEDVMRKLSEELGIQFKVFKFTHNEDSEEHELKFDARFTSNEDMQKFLDGFNSFDLNSKYGYVFEEIGYDYDEFGEFVSVMSICWDVPDADTFLNTEDSYVREYSILTGIQVAGSKENDKKILSGDYCWGFAEELNF